MSDSSKPEPVGETSVPDIGTTTAWYATPAEAADFARQTGFALLPTFMSWDEGKWSKRPRPGCMWKEESTSDPEEVRALWEKYSPGDDPEMRSMISIHCGKSGVFVFDEDDPDKVKGDFKRVMDESERLTLVRRSVSRGTRHVYFRQPDGELKVLDSSFEGGEVKGDGYVAVSTAPPTAGVLPMPAPEWVLELCHLGRPMVTSRSGSSRPALRIENLEAWIAVHSPEPVVFDPDAFMRRRIDEFWNRLGKEHRRMAALYSARAMFAEAMGGMYTLADAYDSLLDAYRESRKRDGTWSSNRLNDFQLMWVGLIDGYDSDGFIGRGGANIHDDIEAVREKLSGFVAGQYDDLMTDEALAEILDEWSWRPEDWVPGDRSTDEREIRALADAPSAAEESPEVPTSRSDDDRSAGGTDMHREALDASESPVVAELPVETVLREPETAAPTAPEPEPEPESEPEVEPPVIAGGSGRGARIVLDEAAYFGPHGEFVKALIPYTEADPAAMLVTTMAYYGAWLAKSRSFERGGSKHSPSIQAVIIGQSSIARKGTSHSMIRRAWEPIMKAPDPEDTDPVYPMGPKPLKQIGGVASGEALIDLMSMPGTRAVMLEEEFVQMLRRIGRQGSTLGTVMRSVFDQKTLETHSRGAGTVKADGDLYSLSFIGHATDDELLSTITAADIYGGSANRMLWVRAHPQRPLPFEKPVPESIYETYRKHLGVTPDRVPSWLDVDIDLADEPTRQLWREIYHRETEMPAHGLYGAVTARAPINILRLALNYAVSVGETKIGVESLRAADALWMYCQETAWSLFGIRTGDPGVDSLLDMLIEVYEDVNQDPWLTSAELRSRYGQRMVATLEKAKTTGLIERVRIPAMDAEGRPKKGRPAEFAMLSDLAVGKLKLPRRKEHPRHSVAFDS